MEFSLFWKDPWLWAVLVAVGSVIFVNGWTDAPTAITTCVASGALGERRAAMLAAVWNLLGIGVTCAVLPAVAQTVTETVQLPQDRPHHVLAVLLCALLATALWAVTAWFFGIPTSESHGMLAGLSGAAVAWQGLSGVRGNAWGLILLGLAVSVLGGVLCGGIAWAVIGRRCASDREGTVRKWLIVGACAMAFMHGAQDGQKFMGIWFLAISLGGGAVTRCGILPAVVCAVLMGAGTLLGGGRIIRTLGEKLIRTGYREGFSADIGAAVCLLLLTILGIPVSTTHTKTAALIGVGAAKGRGRTDTRTVAKLIGAWILTFPACFGAGYCFMKLFLLICR